MPTTALTRRKPPPLWQVSRLLFGGSRRQAFLDSNAVGPLLAAAPRRARRPLALRILGLSPHYFIYQFTSRYPATMSRSEILEAEFARNRESRTEIFEKVLRPHLRPAMQVLDFGCGPGFLAAQVSPHVSRVVAADVSRGTLSCARLLNPSPNVEYVANTASLPVASDSIDLAYSFAVFQHLERAQSLRYLQEFRRVLKPGGTAICQFAIGEGDPGGRAGRISGAGVFDRYRLRYAETSVTELETLLADAGFGGGDVTPIGELADIDDDVGAQHVAVLRG